MSCRHHDIRIVLIRLGDGGTDMIERERVCRLKVEAEDAPDDLCPVAQDRAWEKCPRFEAGTA